MRGLAAVVLFFGLVACGGLSLAACDGPGPTTGGGPAARFYPAPAGSSSRAAAAPASISLTPAPGSTNVPISTEIGTATAGGPVPSVSLMDSAGHPVAGALRDDASAWVPATALSFSTAYTATINVASADGHVTSFHTNFTTMARPSAARIGLGLYLFSGNTYGVAMPIALEFSADIPATARAAVQRRLFVASNPPQTGGWHWFSARQVL